MTRRRVPPIVPILVAVVLGVHGHLIAQTAIVPGAPQLYRVAPPSDYASGCFAPCLCPVLIQDGLIGTFRLKPAAPDPLYANYDVAEVNLFLPQSGVRVTGSGTYKLGSLAARTQELILDLTIDGKDLQHFDSGLVAAGTSFPAIDATVSLNGMSCPDTRLHVVAAPPAPKEVAPYALWRSLYEEGCFGPCACPVRTEPVRGRFGLLKLQDGSDGTDFAVVDLSWLVGPPTIATTAGGYPVTGTGIYRTGSATKTQRMILDLIENGAGPARFDSGTVPWNGGLRRIDVDVSANGFACSDRVFAIHALRRTSTPAGQFAIAPEPFGASLAPAP